MWGCFLMSGVKILHFLKDWWKSIPIHQNYTMALIFAKHAKENILCSVPHIHQYYGRWKHLTLKENDATQKGKTIITHLHIDVITFQTGE